MKLSLWLFPALVLTLIGALTACGGSGGGGGYTPPTAPPPPPPPITTTASGILVNHETGAPMAGIPVAIASWSPATSQYTTVATTAADGSFSFTVANGQYLLRIGTDSPTDGTVTIHDNITLRGGPQALVAPTMPPQPMVTPPAIELSGKYRLANMTSAELNCLSGFNSGRASLSLPLVVEDEWLLENARGYLGGQIANNQGKTFGQQLGTYNTNGGGYTSCSARTQQIFRPGDVSYADGTNPGVLWFGGDFGYLNTTPPQGVVNASWQIDPRTPNSLGPGITVWP